jgi:hypothetical protein
MPSLPMNQTDIRPPCDQLIRRHRLLFSYMIALPQRRWHEDECHLIASLAWVAEPTGREACPPGMLPDTHQIDEASRRGHGLESCDHLTQRVEVCIAEL